MSSTYAIQVDYHGCHCVDRIGSRGVFEPKEAQHMLSLTNSELVCGAQRLKEGSKYSLVHGDYSRRVIIIYVTEHMNNESYPIA